MKRNFFILFSILILSIYTFPSLSFANSSLKIEKIAGRNRYDTAVKISQETFKQSDRAILAYGGNFPDAMFGGVMAAEHKMPILLITKDRIPEEVKNELARLKVKRIYILGGETVVSKSIERELLNKYSVKRLSGKNRFETAMEISYQRDLLDNGLEDIGSGFHTDGDYSSYILTSGNHFADALSVAPFVAQIIPDYEDPYLPYPRGYFRLVPYSPPRMTYGWFIIGGEKAVPSYKNSRDEHGLDGGYRIAGKNRYETAVKIANLYPDSTGKTIDTVILASGTNFPDALASAPLVGSLDAALLLTDPNSLSLETKQYVQSNKIKKVIILGDTNAISQNVINELESITLQ